MSYPGFKHSEETKFKMSASHTGKTGYWLGKTGHRRGKKLTAAQLKRYRTSVELRSDRIWNEGRTGPGSEIWRYQMVHNWIRRKFGAADRCENKECTGVSKIFDWALIHGKTYERIRSHFMKLCRSCHAKYDKKRV